MKIGLRPMKNFTISKKHLYIDSAAAFKYLGQNDVKFLDIRKLEAHKVERIPQSLLATNVLGFRQLYEQQGIDQVKQFYFHYFKNQLKINNDDYVIAYEESLKSQFGPHICHFLLNYLGHKNVSILDGGLESWKSRNLQLQKGSEGIIQLQNQQTIIPDQQFDTVDNLYASEQDVKKAVQTMNKILIDVREEHEFQAGTIPNSINIPLSSIFEQKQNGQYIENQKIQQTLKQKNINNKDDIIVYCMRGLRGSQFQSALQNIGYSNVQLYAGSFLEWKQNQNRIQK